MSTGIQISPQPPRTLGALGKCDWNNPCSIKDKIGYRMEYYNLVFFEHKGRWKFDRIDTKEFLIIIYQTWLQLMMLEKGQDLNGYMFKEFGVYGTKYFIAFGGSEDDRLKPGNEYFRDCRFNCHCQSKQSVPNGNFLWNYIGYTNAKMYFVQRTMSRTEYFKAAFKMEAELYFVDYWCKQGSILDSSLDDATMWEAIGRAILLDYTGFLKVLKEIEAEDAEQLELENDIFFPDDDWIKKTNDEAERAYKSTALAVGAAGLIFLGIMAVTFNKST